MTEKNWTEIERVFYARVCDVMSDAKAFWEIEHGLDVSEPGVHRFRGKVMYIIYPKVKKSPIKYVQAFPFVPLKDLGLSIKANKTASVCSAIVGGGLEIDGMEVRLLKDGANNYRLGFLAFIPKDIMDRQLSRWLHLREEDVRQLSRGFVSYYIRDRTKAMMEGLDAVRGTEERKG